MRVYQSMPTAENVMQFDDVLPTPSSPTFGFHGVDTWRHSGNFPVRREKLKITTILMIQHMYRFDFFMKFYFMDYIKYVVILETNK